MPSIPPSSDPPKPSTEPSAEPSLDPEPGELPDDLFTAADTLFGDRLPLAEQYARMLATDGVERGLIGPRETPRIWQRHVLNCAVTQSCVPPGSHVVDLGSGAGLPGIPLALARPDLRLSLIEPLLRRVSFLDEVVNELALGDRVEVVRGRAEELVAMFHVKPADVATARAVAPLDRLARWALPLIRPGGCLLAIKGRSAGEEVEQQKAAVQRLGGGVPTVLTCGADLLAEPATVVRIVRERDFPARNPDKFAHGGKHRGH